MCGVQETVTHVLVDCPELRDIRGKLRTEVGDAFSGVSSLQGGSTEGERGKPDTVSRAKTVTAVLDLPRRLNGFGVARHEGSLTVGTAIRPRQALTRL